MAATLDPPVSSLSVSDLLFVNAYLANGQNGTKAYQSVHPKAKYISAASTACDLLKKPKVKEEIAQRTRYDVGVTKAWGQSRLLNYEQMARDQGDYIAGASICMDAMKLAGFLIDKKEITTLSVEQTSAVRTFVQSMLASDRVPVVTNGHGDTKSGTQCADDTKSGNGTGTPPTPPHP